MKRHQTTLEVYDKHALSYDRSNAMMERMITKGRPIFSKLHGKILEIGVGTGNNLMYYNPSTNVTALDFSPKMVRLSKLKVKERGITNVKEIIEGDIEKLTEYFKESSFDYVTSTCVFCSVPNPVRGLQEVKKVLKPSGRLIQIEHGLSEVKPVNVILRLLDPITSKWGGFHLSRNIQKNLKKGGFQVVRKWSLESAGILRVYISKPIIN